MEKINVSRRMFLHQLSAGAAVLAANPLDLYAGRFPRQRKLGVALVGLGKYSTGQLGPALKQTNHCRLVSVVTGSREKGDPTGCMPNMQLPHHCRVSGRKGETFHGLPPPL